MDILAARKKAAEQAKTLKPQEPAAAQPVAMQAPEPVQAGVFPAPVSLPPVPSALAEAPSLENTAPAAPGPVEIEKTSPDEGQGAAQVREIELLSFLLGSEEYTVLVDDVREVLKVRDRTLVPNAPDYILGVTSLRGAMLPIIDLRTRLGLAAGESGEKSRIIVVHVADESVGLLVDRVTGVLRVSPDEIKPAPDNIEQGAEYLRGIVRKNDKLYILLDLVKAVGV